MDSSTAETATSSCTTTGMEGVRDTSSTCGETAFRNSDCNEPLIVCFFKQKNYKNSVNCRQGMDSSQDEKGACAILGAQLDEELGGGPVQVGVICLPCSFSHLV